MRLVSAVLVCAVVACAHEQKQVAKLQELADLVKDAVGRGNIPAAKTQAAELAAGISRYENALKLAEAEALMPSDGDPERNWRVSIAAKAAFDASDLVKAETYARELLTFAEKNPKHPDYGIAVFYGNLVLGRVVLARDKNIEDAKAALLAAGKTPGSPTLRSYGPNMTLAKDLLEIGERDVVLEFFDECRKFWKLGPKRLDEWTATVQGCCRMPNFGANLVY